MAKAFLWTARLLPWFVCLAMFLWLVSFRFPISGVSRFFFPFDGKSRWLDAFLPADRVTPIGAQPDGWIGQRITGDPVYATAHAPALFDRVLVGFDIRPINVSLIELGLLRDAAAQSFELHPLFSAALAQGWHRVALSGRTGYVKDGLSDSTLLSEDFSSLLTWGGDVSSLTLMDHGLFEEKEYPTAWQGTYDVYVIPIDGRLSFTISVQDANLTRQGSVALIRVLHNQQVVATDVIQSSGNPDQILKKTILLQSLPAGVYRLSISADDRVSTVTMKTNARHWVIGPALNIGKGSNIKLWTNSVHLTMRAARNEGRQTIRFGSTQTNITDLDQAVESDRSPNETDRVGEITIPNGNLDLIGDGFFTLDPQALFYPKPRRLTDATNLSQEGIRAVLTPYEQPESLGGGWYHVHTSFALPFSQDQLRFMLSLPGIEIRTGSADIRSVELVYTRPKLSWTEFWCAVRKELGLAYHRL
ncbi:MAG TPA: hypothetical protein VFQ60_05410 [Patescibacteria group bacterium]|nr:hypothetical protein [Patescibacteria group bacterium]